jgi:hypothetical protein
VWPGPERPSPGHYAVQKYGEAPRVGETSPRPPRLASVCRPWAIRIPARNPLPYQDANSAPPPWQIGYIWLLATVWPKPPELGEKPLTGRAWRLYSAASGGLTAFHGF